MNNVFDEEQLKRLLFDPYEDLGAEYKSWLDLGDNHGRATVAKSLLAMANHGGGYVIIGFFPNHPPEPDLQCKVNLSDYNSDTINNIVTKFADPPFQCQLRMIKHPKHNMEFPIICVPGGHTVPIRCKASGPEDTPPQRDKYYIRRPGPKSEPPQSAKEWDDLMRRCLLNNKVEILHSFRNILGGVSQTAPSATVEEQLNSWIGSCDSRWHTLVSQVLSQEQPNRFALGYWTIAYKIIGLNESYDIGKLADLVKGVPKQIGIYPAWDSVNRAGSNFVFDTNESFEWRTFEASDERPAAWSDYGRVQSDLSFFFRSGHAEDIPHRSIPAPVPGTALFCSAPVAFFQNSLKHALYICRNLERTDLKVLLRISWTHMLNRSLVAFSQYDQRVFPGPTLFGLKSTQDEISVPIGEVNIRDLESNLSDLIVSPIRTVYRAFNFRPAEPLLKNYIDNFVTEYS